MIFCMNLAISIWMKTINRSSQIRFECPLTLKVWLILLPYLDSDFVQPDKNNKTQHVV